MSTKFNDGGPAFPQPLTFSPEGTANIASEYFNEVSGMSIRDWFAGQALAGLCANPGGPFQANGMSGWAITNCTVGDIANLAVEIADAMIAARQK
jgi:hypothetical protein